MISSILQWDTSLFLRLNGWHNQFADFIFYWISNTYIWIPLYLITFFFLVRKWKKKAIFLIIMLVCTIVFVDQSCNILKNNTQRLRPSHEPTLVEQVHLVKNMNGEYYKGGFYGFPSAHAANPIAFALFVIYFLAQKQKWIIILILSWALLLGYSRIYMGVHYPFDLFFGYFVGAFWALLFPLFYRKNIIIQ